MPATTRAEKLYYAMVCLVAFAIPLPFIVGAIAIGLLVVARLACYRHGLGGRRWQLWLWPLFFALHAVSYFYSADKGQAAFDIQSKLSFLVLPFILGIGPRLDDKRSAYVLQSFVAALVGMALFCLARGVWQWQETGDVQWLFYHKLVDGMDANAVYYSWYTITAVGFLLLSKRLYGWWRYEALYYAALTVLLAFLLLLSSKMLLVLFGLLVPPLYVLSYFRNGRTKYRLVGEIAILCAIGACVYLTNNPIINRYRAVAVNNETHIWLPNGQAVPDTMRYQHFNNLTLRLFLWKIGYENVRDRNLWLTGCGVGDVKLIQKEKVDAYNERYNYLDQDPPLWTFNLHNMYLHTLVMLGLPGLVVFLLICFVPLFYLKRSGYAAAFIVFHVSAILYFMQEAALQTQAGIVYYCFFSVLFWKLCYDRDKAALASTVA